MGKKYRYQRSIYSIIVALSAITNLQFVEDGEKWPSQLVGLVESWTPPSKCRAGRNRVRISRRSCLHKERETAFNDDCLLKLHGISSQGTTDVLPFPTSTGKPLHDRIASILELVDSKILASTSIINIETILERVRKQHCDDFETARSSYLEIEERETGMLATPFSFERIPRPNATEEPPSMKDKTETLAIRSVEPILDGSSVKAVKNAAEDVWKAEKGDGASTSRFTYQYSGNSEAHVFDFIQSSINTETEEATGSHAIKALNKALQEKIYPTIRKAFFQTNNDPESDDGTRLFVYDALVIRYNSTKAAEAAEITEEVINSAGQPLHRDLGLVSVNIMLNSADDFEGGGTFFENQLLEADSASTIEPLKPSGVGYCLAHSASERHAGAGTTAGVRDILVLFVSACTSVGDAIGAPAELISARLKNCRAFCECETEGEGPIESEEAWLEQQRSILLCRILHQRLAVTAGGSGIVSDSLLTVGQQSYCDGEALQYLGTALMEYSAISTEIDVAIEIMEIAAECFRVATIVTPSDSRVYNNLGIILGRIDEKEQKSGGPPSQRMIEQEAAYHKGMDILQRSIRAGCTNESLTKDLESLTLNFGLFVANQDRFQDAAEILEPVALSSVLTQAGEDAYRLWEYCRKRCEEQLEQ